MEITAADESRVVAAMNNDIQDTIGAGDRLIVEQMASHYREFFNDTDSIDATADEYMEKVAEQVQQHFHDSFADTVWPACPLHGRHPLWLKAGHWTCTHSGTPIAKLGELRASGADSSPGAQQE